MRGHGPLAAAGAVLLVVVAAAAAAVLLLPRHYPPGGTFQVAGQSIDCTETGLLILEVALFYPGPQPALILDGEPLDGQHPGGDPYEYRPTTRLEFPCADRDTHRIQIVTGRSNAIDTGCQISLVAPLTPINGKDIRPYPVFNANEFTCDLTWTD